MLTNTSGQKIGAQLVSATDGSAFTGSVTVHVTGDAGTQATGSVGSGAATHEGNGYHTYAPSQAETNYDLVAFTFTGSGAIPVTVQVYTRAGDAFTRLGAPAGASVSADIAAIKAETASILTDTAEIGTAGAGLTAINLPDQSMNITGNITGNLSGSVGSVTGAVGSVTGNVGGNVTGSIGSLATQAKADVNAAADSALSDYDPPTKAELDSAVSPLATSAALATVDGNVDSILTDTGTTLPATLSTIAGYLDTEVAAIKAVTDLLPDAGALSSLATASALSTVDTVVDAVKVVTDKLADTVELDSTVYRFTSNALEQAPSGSGASAATIAAAVWDEDLTGHTTDGSAGKVLGNVATGTPPSAASIADAVWDEAASGHVTAGTLGKAVADILVDTAEIGAAGAGLTALASAADLATVDANVDAILVDTGTTLQAELDGIQADTEDIQSRLPAALTVAGNLKADAQVVSDKTGYALTAAYDAAKTAASQTSVDDLPTNAELTTALAGADDATLTAIAALDIPTASENATAVLTAAESTPIEANVKQINDTALTGDGSSTPWGPA